MTSGAAGRITGGAVEDECVSGRSIEDQCVSGGSGGAEREWRSCECVEDQCEPASK
jgi:hypothetical protein